jgi:phenylacetate-CoA ligase
MTENLELMAVSAFRNAAARVPAYQEILREAGVHVPQIDSAHHFLTLPVLNKGSTFQRFELSQLCTDGQLGQPGTVLTSSGHSGIFAFGVTDADAAENTVEWIDHLLDFLFAVRSRPTLLINCLPMGVKVPTRACTLAEVSVRADMAVGLMKSMGSHFAQIILIGEAAFIKHVLETGVASGVEWRNHVVQVILGEEPLAENARRYLGGILGHDLRRPERGIIFSSMGVAEIGLNLFFEVPPVAPLVLMRRAMHEDPSLREAILGSTDSVPSLFTYDQQRVLVEFDHAGRLILTTLDLNLRIPLIRYAPGDRGAFVELRPQIRPAIEAHGLPWDVLHAIPIMAIYGRGEHALSGDAHVYPEAVKEGIYHDSNLARLTTANFRLISGVGAAEIRIQLSPGMKANEEIERGFRAAISNYVRVPFTVSCHDYDDFKGGMSLDYERKFRYVES